MDPLVGVHYSTVLTGVNREKVKMLKYSSIQPQISPVFLLCVGTACKGPLDTQVAVVGALVGEQ